MRRDFTALGAGRFDLLVIGGGIYGAWTAYDAALRGLRVAIVERADWAAGTSSASSKLIHGGLRYLERLRLGLVRVSLDERRRLARLGPHRVRPLRFMVPIYRGARVGAVRWRLGLTLYDLLAGRRQPVAPHASHHPSDVARRLPFLRADGLVRGVSYGDCQTDDARFVLEVIDGAVEAGAVAVNRAAVDQLRQEGARVTGALVRDAEANRSLEVSATVTVDCGGPWSAERHRHEGAAPTPIRMTKGVHLVLPALPGDTALLLLAPADGRVVFLIPWHGRTLLGTTDTPYDGDPDAVAVEADDVAYLLDAANAYLTRPVRRDDVIGRFAGLRVLRDQPGVDPSDVSREYDVAQPAPGLVVPVGGKYSTARADAAGIVDRVMTALGRRPGARPTADRALPWAPPAGLDDWLADVVARGVALGLDAATARETALRFGTRADRVHTLIVSRPDLAGRLHPDLPFCRAEVVHAVENEMARGLEDILRRRIPLAILTRPDARVVADAAALAAPARGWTSAERAAEVAHLLAHAGAPPGGADP